MHNIAAEGFVAHFGEVIEYNVVLAQLADGKIHVALTATTVDEDEPQLVNQEIANGRVATIDEALAVIKAGIVNENDTS